MRRFYQVLKQATVALVLWLSVMLYLSFSCCTTREIKENPYKSTMFFVMQMPLYGLVLFGCYALISIGFHLLTLSNKPFLKIL